MQWQIEWYGFGAWIRCDSQPTRPEAERSARLNSAGGWLKTRIKNTLTGEVIIIVKGV